MYTIVTVLCSDLHMNLSTNFDDWAIMDFFVSMLIVGIGVALLATGLFTSYFGAGKSQKIGFGLLFAGVATLVIIYALTFDAGMGVADQFGRSRTSYAWYGVADSILWQ